MDIVEHVGLKSHWNPVLTGAVGAGLVDLTNATVTDGGMPGLAGTATVMIAGKGQNLETKTGQARHTLLGDAYGLREKDLLFFPVHQQEDIGHVMQA